MSVTIITSAGTHTPAFNNQNLVASSTNSAQPNFKYKVIVQINDGTYDNDTVLRIPKRPDNSYLYYNPGEISRNYVKTPFRILDAINYFFYPDVSLRQYFKKVTVGIDEEYGSPVSGFAGVSASYYVWNAAYNSLEFADYLYAATTKAKDLTLSPSLVDTIHYDQKYLFKTWHKGFSTRDIRYLFLTCTDVFGNQIQDVVIENLYYSVGANYERNYISLNCSPESFNTFNGAPIIYQAVAGDLVPSNTAYYTFYFSQTNPPLAGISSNVNTVYISNLCSKYDRYVLHFLNSLGNWDSFTFNKVSRNNTDKETSEFKQIPYSLDSANKYRYEKYTNDTVIYNTVLKNKWTLNTDFITEAKSEWLRDLFASPEIRLETDTGDIIAVKCTLKSYETKKKVNEKLFNLTIELENALQDIRQC